MSAIPFIMYIAEYLINECIINIFIFILVILLHQIDTYFIHPPFGEIQYYW